MSMATRTLRPVARGWHAATAVRHAPVLHHYPPRQTTTCARGFVASAVNQQEKRNWLLGMLGYYGEESTRIRNAEALLQSCENQAARKAWYGRGRVPSEFRPKHAMLMTHVWLVHKRLMGGGGDSKSNKLLQEALFDELWENTQLRIRNMGINELMVNKNLGDVQKYSFPMLLSFDQAVAEADPEERLDHLGAAAWRNIWLADRKLTVEHCMEMAAYLHRSQAMLEATDLEAVAEGRIAWENVPSWKGIKSSVADPLPEEAAAETAAALESSSELDGRDEDEDEGDWREALSKHGKVYYWNVKTRETRWEKPASMSSGPTEQAA